MFRLVEGLGTDSNKVVGGSCIRGMDEKLCFSEKERGIVRKDYMERIINEESDWDYNVDEDAVVYVSREMV